MQGSKVFSILCLLMLALGTASPLSAAGNPPGYDRAKSMLENLQSGKGDAASWDRCAALFQKIWRENPRWAMRPAALYRSAAALEGKARVTRAAGDARKARSVYEQTARDYPKSLLADDALYRSAVVSRELLGDDASARANIVAIAKSYPRSDHAKAAAEYGKKLGLPGLGPDKASKKQPPSADGKPAPGKTRGIPHQGQGIAAKPFPGDHGRRNLAAQLGLSVRNIVLDAGHGGKDPGTMHFGVIEREITLDIVKRMEKLLLGKGYAVYLSRRSDGWVSLADRVRFGRRMKGDLFVSIHVNACDNPLVSGMETYVLDFARTSAISRLAMSENADSGRLGDMDRVLAEILIGARTSESRRLAACIQRRSVESLKSKGTSIIDGGVKGAPFFVLVGASMPSVLVEIGYCTNEAEANRLKLPGQRQFIAEGIVDGILTYAGKPDGRQEKGRDPQKKGEAGADAAVEKGGARPVGKAASGTGLKGDAGRNARNDAVKRRSLPQTERRGRAADGGTAAGSVSRAPSPKGPSGKPADRKAAVRKAPPSGGKS